MTDRFSEISILAVGACIGAATAMAVTSRNKAAMENALRQAASPGISQELRQHVFQSISASESRLASQINTHAQQSLEKLQGIHQSQQGLQTVETKLDSIQSIFLHPKQRGTVGELHLERLVSDVYAPTLYSFQSTLSNGKRPDCVLKWGPNTKVCIDSKFSLDAFALEDVDLRTRKVGESLKKHIKDVSTKYIIPGETMDYAVLFIPSESVYLEIVDHHSDLIVQAHRSKVWMASPTTLIIVLNLLQSLTRDMQVQQNTESLIQEIKILEADMKRLSDRQKTAEKQLANATESIRQLGISKNKILLRSAKILETLPETSPVPSLDTSSRGLNGTPKQGSGEELSTTRATVQKLASA